MVMVVCEDGARQGSKMVGFEMMDKKDSGNIK